MTAPRRVRLDFRFWLVTAAAMAAMAATAALGRWQLDRAAQKEALHSAIVTRMQLPPLEARAFERLLAFAPGDLLHRRVVLRGRWLAGNTVFLDNRQMQRRQGFIVVTPLQLEGSAATVLVQRGWVPRNFQDRTALPPVVTPGGLVELHGRVAAPPARLLELEGSRSAEGSSRIRQNLDLEAFRAETGLPLADVSVLQTDAESGGLLRQWPQARAGVEKNYGYAFQWFGLCSLIAILYVWFQLVRRFIRPRSASS